MSELSKLFEKGEGHPHIATFAYPIFPEHFKQYKAETSIIERDLSSTTDLSLYLNVPFCEAMCAFCHYVVSTDPKGHKRDAYVEAIKTEIDLYYELCGKKNIVGFDIGGGTPTTLTIDQLHEIVEHTRILGLDIENLVASIETTPKIAARDKSGIEKLLDIGFKRLSMGVQAIGHNVQRVIGRPKGNDESPIKLAIMNARDAGFKDINLDVVYGIKDQTIDDLRDTLEFVTSLNPDVISLFRMIYNGTRISAKQTEVQLSQYRKLYNFAFSFLVDNGYHASSPGQNIFTRDPSSSGYSSYSEQRMLNSTPYLGLGPCAHSLHKTSLTFNNGNRRETYPRYSEDIQKRKLPVQDCYDLPIEEMLAKAIIMNLYYGCIHVRNMDRRFNLDIKEIFRDEIEFLVDEGYMTEDMDKLILTKKGANHINGVIPFFYSPNSRTFLMSQ